MLNSDILWELAEHLMGVIETETGFPVVVYDEHGTIRCATEASRFGNRHLGAEKIMRGRIDEYAVTPEEAARNPQIREGYSCPITIDGQRVAAFGITGKLNLAKPLARMAAKMIDAWIAEQKHHLLLKASEQKYRGIFDHTTQGIFQSTLDGRLVTANQALARMYSYPSPEALLAEVTDAARQLYVNPEDRRRLITQIEAEGHVTDFFTQYKRRDGQIIDVRLNAHFVSIAKTGQRLIEGIVEDITSRKKAEKALKLSEEKYFKAFNNSPVWVVLSSLETGRYIEVNETFVRNMGYAREEIIGRTSRDMNTWFDPADRHNIMAALKVEGSVKNHEVKRRTKTGRILTMLFSAEVIDVAGEACMLSVSQDISERQQAEKQLRISENNLRITLDSIGDAVITTDTDGAVTRMNPMAEKLTGWTTTEAAGRPLPEVFHIVNAHTREKVENPAAKVLASGKLVGLANHTVLLTREGREYQIADSGAPIRSSDGRVVGVVLVFRDVTDAYAREQKIRDHEALLAGLTANIPGVVYQFAATPHHDYRLRFVSEKAVDIFGLDAPLDSFFNTFLHCIPEDEQDDFLTSIRDAVETVGPWYYEGRFIKPSGEIIWFAGGSSPHLDGDNVLFDGVLMDITARRKADEALRLNEKRLEALVELNQMTTATMQSITDFTLEKAVQLTSSEIGYLAFTNEDESVLTMHSGSKTAMAACNIEDKQRTYAVDRTGLWGEAVRQRKPMITNDYPAPNVYKKGYPEGHVSLKRHMNVPVFDGERIVAVAGVGNKKTDYEDSDVRQLTLLMQGMWRMMQRKQDEEALRNSEERFRRLLQEAPIPLALAHDTGRIQFFNDRFTAYYGYTVEDIPDLDTWWQAAYPDPIYRKQVIDIWEKAFAKAIHEGAAVEPHEYKITCKDGRIRIAEVSAIILGDIYLATWVDLTERHQAREEIRQRQQFLELVLYHAPDAIVTMDADHRIIDWNPGAERMFGYSPAEALGRELDALVASGDAWPDAQRKTRQVLAGQRVEAFETIRYRKDGKPLSVIAAGSPILVEGVLRGVVAVYTDITAQKQAEARLKGSHERFLTVLESIDANIHCCPLKISQLGHNTKKRLAIFPMQRGIDLKLP